MFSQSPFDDSSYEAEGLTEDEFSNQQNNVPDENQEARLSINTSKIDERTKTIFEYDNYSPYNCVIDQDDYLIGQDLNGSEFLSTSLSINNDNSIDKETSNNISNNNLTVSNNMQSLEFHTDQSKDIQEEIFSHKKNIKFINAKDMQILKFKEEKNEHLYYIPSESCSHSEASKKLNTRIRGNTDNNGNSLGNFCISFVPRKGGIGYPFVLVKNVNPNFKIINLKDVMKHLIDPAYYQTIQSFNYEGIVVKFKQISCLTNVQIGTQEKEKPLEPNLVPHNSLNIQRKRKNSDCNTDKRKKKKNNAINNPQNQQIFSNNINNSCSYYEPQQQSEPHSDRLMRNHIPIPTIPQNATNYYFPINNNYNFQPSNIANNSPNFGNGNSSPLYLTRQNINNQLNNSQWNDYNTHQINEFNNIVQRQNNDIYGNDAHQIYHSRRLTSSSSSNAGLIDQGLFRRASSNYNNVLPKSSNNQINNYQNNIDDALGGNPNSSILNSFYN